jgi:hypothetical protein
MDPETETTSSLASDKLRGVGPISSFIGEPPTRTYYLLESGQLPAGKLGRRWIASKQTLTEHYRKITNPAPGKPQEERTIGLAPPRRGRPRKTADRR